MRSSPFSVKSSTCAHRQHAMIYPSWFRKFMLKYWCSLILTVTSNCLWVFLLNANVPSGGKSKGTLVVNTGKSIGAFLFMFCFIVSEVCVVDKRLLYISKSFGSRTTVTGSPSKVISGIKSISLFFIPR